MTRVEHFCVGLIIILNFCLFSLSPIFCFGCRHVWLHITDPIACMMKNASYRRQKKVIFRKVTCWINLYAWKMRNVCVQGREKKQESVEGRGTGSNQCWLILRLNYDKYLCFAGRNWGMRKLVIWITNQTRKWGDEGETSGMLWKPIQDNIWTWIITCKLTGWNNR